MFKIAADKVKNELCIYAVLGLWLGLGDCFCLMIYDIFIIHQK